LKWKPKTLEKHHGNYGGETQEDDFIKLLENIWSKI
jgi:hypothetical protein